jgi:hypothetical protein
MALVVKPGDFGHNSRQATSNSSSGVDGDADIHGDHRSAGGDAGL